MVDLITIIEEVKTELAETLQEKNAIIETDSLCKVNVVPFQFRQLMINLLANTLKFSRQDIQPQIKITSQTATGFEFQNENPNLLPGSLLPARNYCCTIFSDNGIGFDPKFQNKIFEVFQRLHNKQEYEGTGIGLAIVKRIVENHNGFITATGEINKGATFHIYIPIEHNAQ